MSTVVWQPPRCNLQMLDKQNQRATSFNNENATSTTLRHQCNLDSGRTSRRPANTKLRRRVMTTGVHVSPCTAVYDVISRDRVAETVRAASVIVAPSVKHKHNQNSKCVSITRPTTTTSYAKTQNKTQNMYTNEHISRIKQNSDRKKTHIKSMHAHRHNLLTHTRVVNAI